MANTMLTTVKTALRLSGETFDSEISMYIGACFKDLEQYGVDSSLCTDSTEDELIIATVIAYCRWQYDFEDQGERYEKMYQNLYQVLSMRGDYNGTNEQDSDPNS